MTLSKERVRVHVTKSGGGKKDIHHQHHTQHP